MSGIYIHIPFCKQACHYCDFHFSTSLNTKDAFLSALKKEIELQKDYLKTPSPAEKAESRSDRDEASTIYFGGGTPSLLSQKEILNLFDELNKHFAISEDAEITLEANPDDLTKEKISDLKQTPVNRLSIGIQSFSDQDLKFMNRAHNGEEADRSVKTAQDKGFENISIDLIYGTPTMSNEEWKKNLVKAFALNVPHISAYCLTVEARTPLADMVKKGKAQPVDEQKASEQFEIMLSEMKRNGFTQYEISNFCKGDSYSKHNSNYWKGEHYLGLGPSAHSFDGASRQWNVRNNNAYIKSLSEGKLDHEREVLTKEQKFNEYILTSLRTMWGTDLKKVEMNFGNDFLSHLLNETQTYFDSGILVKKENKLYLSDMGKLIADKIASDLFKV